MSAQGVVNAVHDADLDVVLAIWRDVLGTQHGTLGADSNFFLCGGDSLDLMRVRARVRERFGIELDLREASSFSTPRRMAQRCLDARAARAVTPVSPPVAAERSIAGRLHDGGVTGSAVAQPSAVLPAQFPCNEGQRGMWLAEQLGGGGLYNTAVLVHFTGALRVPVLAQALSRLLYRHEVLRCRLRYERGGQHLVAQVAEPCEVALDAEPVHADAVRQVLVDAAAQPFDLEHGPLWRFRLLQADTRRWTLLFALHHAVTDGWSGHVLLHDLANGYRTLLRDAAWRPECVDTEFRRWSMQQCSVEADMGWWRDYLAGADRLSSWPPVADKRWPYTMCREERTLSSKACADLRRVARSRQLRPAALFLATLRLALMELAGISELCIGMPVNLRDGSAHDSAVGYFVNLLVLRDEVGGDGMCARQRCAGAPGRVADTVRRIQHTLDEALLRRHVSFGELARRLRPVLLPSGNPWCDILFAFQNLPRAQPDFGDVSVRIEALTMPRGQHPLKVEVVSSAESYVWRLEYARECLDAGTVRALLDTMERQLAVVLAGAARSS